MEKLTIIALIALLITQSSILYGHDPAVNHPVFSNMTQPDDPWPEKSSSVSAYLTALLGVHLNLSYNYLKYTGKFFHGVSGGLSMMGVNGVTFGPQLTCIQASKTR